MGGLRVAASRMFQCISDTGAATKGGAPVSTMYLGRDRWDRNPGACLILFWACRVGMRLPEHTWPHVPTIPGPIQASRPLSYPCPTPACTCLHLRVSFRLCFMYARASPTPANTSRLHSVLVCLHTSTVHPSLRTQTCPQAYVPPMPSSHLHPEMVAGALPTRAHPCPCLFYACPHQPPPT